MSWLERDGQLLYFEDTGETQLAPLVLVHGLTCDATDWDAQVSHFAGRRRVVCVELRGHGRSLGFEAGFEMTSLGGDVGALLEHLDLHGAVVAGHSMGCRVALAVSSAAAARVAGVVLIDGSRFATGSGDAARAVVASQVAAVGQRAMAHKLFTQMFTAASDARVRRRAVDRALRVPEAVFVKLMQEMSAWDAEHFDPVVAALDVPVLALQSTHVNEQRERIVLGPGDSTPYLESLRERAPHAHIEVIANTGHFTMIDAASTVNTSMDAWLSSINRNTP